MVPITSTFALTNATLPYVLRLADNGLDALKTDAGFLDGLNIAAGTITYAPVANDQGLAAINPHEALTRVPALA